MSSKKVSDHASSHFGLLLAILRIGWFPLFEQGSGEVPAVNTVNTGGTSIYEYGMGCIKTLSAGQTPRGERA